MRLKLPGRTFDYLRLPSLTCARLSPGATFQGADRLAEAWDVPDESAIDYDPRHDADF